MCSDYHLLSILFEKKLENFLRYLVLVKNILFINKQYEKIWITRFSLNFEGY